MGLTIGIKRTRWLLYGSICYLMPLMFKTISPCGAQDFNSRINVTDMYVVDIDLIYAVDRAAICRLYLELYEQASSVSVSP